MCVVARRCPAHTAHVHSKPATAPPFAHSFHSILLRPGSCLQPAAVGSDDAHRQITAFTACCTATARFGMDGNVKVTSRLTTAAYWQLPHPRRPFRAVRRSSGAAVSRCSGIKPDRKIRVAVTRWARRPLCATSRATIRDPTERRSIDCRFPFPPMAAHCQRCAPNPPTAALRSCLE